MKFRFNPNTLAANPTSSFRNFSRQVIQNARATEHIDTPSFSSELYTFGDIYDAVGNKKELNNFAIQLAEQLVNAKQGNLAGIIYSFLMKFNFGNNKVLEEIALNALAIAKRQHDPIHIMARASDLRKIYKFTDREKYLKYLYVEKRALNDICKNYKNLDTRYNRQNREVRPLVAYQLNLGIVKTLIGEELLHTQTNLAIEELKGAYDILLPLGKGRYTKKIENLLRSVNINI